MAGAATTPRFCFECGTRLVHGAKFCSNCGTDLRAGVPQAAKGPAAAPAGWQLTTGGLGLLGFMLVAGLAMWAAILSPEPPRAGLGAAPRTAAAPEAGAQGPPQPVELPAEVKTFITDLAEKAKQSPDDAAVWVRLGNVYYRAAQLDPSYYPRALDAFDHVLAADAGNLDAIKGKANVFYDKNDHAQAIPLYEKVLAANPDDPNARTDLSTMYLAAGDPKKAIEGFESVIAQHPDFLQAHYNLAVTHAQLGHTRLARERFRIARELATDDATRKQIDDMVARLGSGPAEGGGAPPGVAGGMAGSVPPAMPPAAGAPAVPPAAVATAGDAGGGARTPFQAAVEKAFRSAPIMGERIVGFRWDGPATGRVLVQSFPMDAMPPAVRDKFASRLAQELRTAAEAAKPDGPVRMEIADATAGTVMSTVTP